METNNDPETYAIIGAAMSVHRELGHGFLEAVYQSALEKEFENLNISFDREKKIHVHYKGAVIANYQADFICYDKIIVELKALKKITGAEKAQVINYLKATKYHKALLINFGSSSLQYERIVFNQCKSAKSADKQESK
jgi:GxxExxY protein